MIGDHAGVGRRDDDVLGEPTVSLDTDADDVTTVVELASPAVAASPADDMAFAGNPVADLDAPHVGGDGIDETDELVANSDARRDVGCGPVVPGLDVEVGATDGGPADLDPHFARPGFRHRQVTQFEPGSGTGLHEGLHDTTPNS